MTGPEHYRAAETAIENAKYTDVGSDKERFFIAVAQVHATLALAAATAISGHQGREWYAAAGQSGVTAEANANSELLDRNAEGTAVMDGDEYYASMAAETIDPFDAYTDAQLDGTACINCGNEFGPDEASPAVMGPRGQMFEHIYPSGCGVAK